jgi:DNA-binding response OmpR family regulator
MSTDGGGDLSHPVVLVVDDDLQIRQTIRWALEEEGFVVETASDGQQALERATSARPALVVLDMRLPLVDGAAVADGLRSSLKVPPPIVLITADDRPAEKARRVGAYAYLEKPFELDDLVATVRRGLRARSE